ncbi:MAG: hypothetical protein GXY57_01310 [Erysipelotrichaceae bacterium]|nr:hypothetical protein [Erysipelotrichaceae bacterium]
MANTLYRPTIKPGNYNTPKRYSRFIKQFADPNDWGFKKHHVYSWSEMEEYLADGGTSHTLKDTYNYTLTFVKGKYFGSGKNKRRIDSLDDIFLIDRDSDDFPQLRQKWETEGKLSFKRTRHLCLEHHLWAARNQSKSNYLYYTSSPHKRYNLLCCDIDHIKSDDAYRAVANYLLSFFPTSYYERSTNGTGLHFYIIVAYHSDRLFSEVNEGLFRNLLSYLLSEAFAAIVNTRFSVKFDGIKGTCPLYDINHHFIKYGALVKLPAPMSYEQFRALYSCSVYSEYYLLCVINYLNDSTGRYFYKQFNGDSLSSALSSLPPDVPITASLSEIVSYITETSEIHSPLLTPYLPTTITNGGRNALPGKKTGVDTMQDILEIGDSRIRESLYIKHYVGEYYRKYKSIPPEDDVEKNYRIDTNYTKQGPFRKKRFSKYYKHTVDTFDPAKASAGSAYVIGVYNTAIVQTDEQITDWVRSHTSYKYKVYRYDVDITLEYIYMCSMNWSNKARESLVQKYARQEGISVQCAAEQLRGTTPRRGLECYYRYIKRKYLISDNNSYL